MGLFDMNTLNPYPTTGFQYQRPITPINPQPRDLEKVNGIESARQYQMPPNSRVALFDTNDDIFYVRETDASGFPTIRAFRFTEVTATPAQEPQQQFVTMEEFEKFKQEVLNGQQSVRFNTGNTSGKSKHGQPKANDANVQNVE